MAWDEDQQWEKEWHGNCVNSINEELKQLVYAGKMGLKQTHNIKTPYTFNLEQKSILDVGGGPYSLLLKCENFKKAVVVDPCEYPAWVHERYKSAGIDDYRIAGEDFLDLKLGVFDEVWIYNVLQHTRVPEKILTNIRKSAKIIRIFEWVETGTAIGHPQNLTKPDLDKWLGGVGKVENINQGGCVGLCYYGIFKGNHYEE